MYSEFFAIIVGLAHSRPAQILSALSPAMHRYLCYVVHNRTYMFCISDKKNVVTKVEGKGLLFDAVIFMKDP